MSAEFKVDLLGEIPVITKIRTSGDEGRPLVAGDPGSQEAKIFIDISKRIIREINLMNTDLANSSDIVIEI